MVAFAGYPINPIVSGNGSTNTISFSVSGSDGTNLIWSVYGNNLTVRCDPETGSTSTIVSYSFADAGEQSGTISVTATDRSNNTYCTGTIFVLPHDWNKDNTTLIDDTNGNTYALKYNATTDPIPMAIGLGTMTKPDGPPVKPDPFVVARQASPDKPINWTDSATSIACYVLLLDRFPPIGRPAVGPKTAPGTEPFIAPGIIDLRLADVSKTREA